MATSETNMSPVTVAAPSSSSPSFVSSSSGFLNPGGYAASEVQNEGRADCEKFRVRMGRINIKSRAAYHSQGFEDKNLGSSPGQLGQ